MSPGWNVTWPNVTGTSTPPAPVFPLLRGMAPSALMPRSRTRRAFRARPVGDVYLVGRLPLLTVTPDEVDRLLGCVLSYADDNFDAALESGFASSIRTEWQWRASRGENLADRRAFARFSDPARLACPPACHRQRAADT